MVWKWLFMVWMTMVRKCILMVWKTMVRKRLFYGLEEQTTKPALDHTRPWSIVGFAQVRLIFFHNVSTLFLFSQFVCKPEIIRYKMVEPPLRFAEIRANSMEMLSILLFPNLFLSLLFFYLFHFVFSILMMKQ
jgi:hypothetical protein